MISRDACHGCRDDYYNQPGNALDGKRCWNAKSARIITRFEIDINTRPGQPGAFTQVKRPSCFGREGSAFYNTLPDFVKLEDVIGATRRRKPSVSR